MINNKKRLTIAYISSILYDRIGYVLWEGISDAADENNINLICFNLNSSDKKDFNSNEDIVYKCISNEIIDGVILWSSKITAFFNKERSLEFLNRFNEIPTVSIGRSEGITDIPVVYLDDENSIAAIMEHLAGYHNFKKIAFVKGVENHLPSQNRFRAYLNELKKYNIKIDERMISEPAQAWRPNYGVKALNLFLDQRKLIPKRDIEAIITINDYMAIEITEELKLRKIKVPEDIAVTGFNDSSEGRAAKPPLTGFNLNEYTIGKKSVRVLIDKINGKNIQKKYLIKGDLIVRESCGCFYNTKTVSQNDGIKTGYNGDAAENYADLIYNELILSFETVRNLIKKEFIKPLFDAFISDLNNNKNVFASLYHEFFLDMHNKKQNLNVCFKLLAIIRKYILMMYSDSNQGFKIEQIIYSAQTLIIHSINNIFSKNEFQDSHRVSNIPDLGLKLMNVLKMSDIGQILSETLMDMNILSCYISFFDDKNNPLRTSRLIIACKDRKVIDVNNEYGHNNAEILFKDIFSGVENRQIIMQSLSNESGQFGFMVLESRPNQMFSLEIISNFINDAVQKVLLNEERENLLKELEKKVEERTAELNKTNKRLQEAISEAVGANKAKSLFLTNISHEIRTPLNCIVGFTEILGGSGNNEEKEFCQLQIIDQSNKIILLVNQLLDLSKIEAGKFELDYKVFNLRHLMTAINNTFSVIAGKKGLNYIVEMPEDFPELITGDALRIRQILENLINNAVKFTVKGYIKVSLEILSRNSEKIQILFNVIDTGVGIPEDKKGFIFDNFVQIKNKNINAVGTGLGTTIAKQLTELMGGAIGVDSSLNSGSTFWFKIEFQTGGAADEKIEEKKDLTLNADYDIRSKAVLLVEDYKLAQKIALHHLESIGVKVIIAENGAEAIEIIKNNQIDLVLMDIQMPGMDGNDAALIIRNELKFTGLPIIAMTANAFSEDREKCFGSGMNDVIVKPFTGQILQNKVIQWLAKS